MKIFQANSKTPRVQLYIKNCISLAVALLMTTGCKKWIEVPAPSTSLNAANVYTSDATATSVVTGIYSKLSNTAAAAFTIESMSFIGGISADEFTLFSGVTLSSFKSCYVNGMDQSNNVDVWSSIYPYIYKTNDAIAGIAASSSLTPAVKQQLLGEAKFLRAFFYFYLTNLYGDVPLILSTDYNITAIVPKTAQGQIYQQIIKDLTEAENQLNSNYLDATLLQVTADRIRPTKGAAAALLARVYLYANNDFVNAEKEATKVISNTATYSLSSLAGTFLKNSTEAIWQWQPVVTGYNTQEGRVFNLPKTGPNSNTNPVYLNTQLLNAFEPGDGRRTNWISSVTVASGTTYYFPFKYKVGGTYNGAVTSTTNMTEYEMILRLGEQYLVRAEARAKQNNIFGANSALADLNLIRNRAGLLAYSGATDQNSVLAAIMKERRVELFSEWGHRWFDLKRTQTVDAVMGAPGNAAAAKGGAWKTTSQLFPIPILELQRNTALTQNLGY